MARTLEELLPQEVSNRFSIQLDVQHAVEVPCAHLLQGPDFQGTVEQPFLFALYSLLMRQEYLNRVW